MKAGEINKGVWGQEEVGDDGRDGVQLRCEQSRKEHVRLSDETRGWTAAAAWKPDYLEAETIASICQSFRN